MTIHRQRVDNGTALLLRFFFFFSSRRRHTSLQGDWSSDVCSSDLSRAPEVFLEHRVDLLILDVLMPGTTGLQLLDSISAHPLQVILTSSEHRYAVEEIGRASCRERGTRRVASDGPTTSREAG